MTDSTKSPRERAEEAIAVIRGNAEYNATYVGDSFERDAEKAEDDIIRAFKAQAALEWWADNGEIGLFFREGKWIAEYCMGGEAWCGDTPAEAIQAAMQREKEKETEYDLPN